MKLNFLVGISAEIWLTILFLVVWIICAQRYLYAGGDGTPPLQFITVFVSFVGEGLCALPFIFAQIPVPDSLLCGNLRDVREAVTYICSVILSKAKNPPVSTDFFLCTKKRRAKPVF